MHASDGHNSDELGRRFTWVKMTRPNLEGLRLALLDGAASLKPAIREEPGNPNAHAALAIESITVHKGKFIGRPSNHGFVQPVAECEFGGRGTANRSLTSA